jgi:RND family efflux transporter MFP subunit
MNTTSRKRILIASGSLVLLLTIGAVPRALQSLSLSHEWKEKSQEAVSVSTTPVAESDGVTRLSLPGTAQAIQSVAVYARVDGYLKTRYADIGSVVHKGQLLAEVDAPELDQQAESAYAAVEQAKANLESAREKLAKAESDKARSKAEERKVQTDVTFNAVQYKRYKVLSEQGAVSESDRDQKEQALGAAEADRSAALSAIKASEAAVSSAQADVRVAQAAVKSALAAANRYKALEGFKRIVAPFDGTVTKRNVDAGALISSSNSSGDKQLFEIANVDRLRIFVNVPEAYISYIKRGERVQLEFQAFPADRFVGEVANIAGGLDPSTKTLQVEVQIANADHRLLPGMFAQAEFEALQPTKLAVVPTNAIVSRPDGPVAFVVDSGHRISLRKIDVARDLGGKVELQSGLHSGETVVINAPDNLKPGMIVQPVAIAVKE